MGHKNDYSESVLVQEPAAEFLQQQLGWDSVMAQNEGPLVPEGLLGRTADTQVVLTRDVLAALRRLNPNLPEAAYTQALEAVLHHDSAQSLLQTNQDKYRLLRDGVLVKVRDPASGQWLERRLRLIDFDAPQNNRFLAVRELWVRGPIHLRRPDLLGYVNGLPLVFIEFKRFDVPVDAAYKHNYADYRDTIPHLFHWNALVVISNGLEAQYGSLTATPEHFYRWKRLDEDDPEPNPNQPQLNLLLRGLMERGRLLDIVENFVLFDAGADGVQKIVPRNHQYLGVNRVIERLTSTDPAVQAEVAQGRLGVFWHTQGSGKSYSMVFLSEKIRRKVSARYTFVVVTDRTELDGQIAGTYTTTGRASARADQARSGDALRSMLREQNRSYVFGMVQKYRERVTEPYSERSDIIVLSDEAHRTQYGRLAQNMRRGLPRAKFLGFTGTPLIDADEKQLTRKVFGDYVSIYDFKRAVADGATLPLFYENRGDKLKITDPKLNERLLKHIEAAKEAATADDPWTEEKEDKLYRKLASDYPVLTAPTRLDRVATDFVDHFAQRRIAVAQGNSKALVVCLDKITCVRLFDLIDEKWRAKTAALDAEVSEEEAKFAAKGKTPGSTLLAQREKVEWMKATEICVVVSQEQGEVAEFKKWQNHRNEPLDITPHREKMVKRALEADFKKAEHPFRVAIVCAMWLTGFDVKSLATLYLDKPMQGHALMQAIARVNRVGGGKKMGLVIDYNGMLRSLREALATFAQGDRKGTGKGDAEDETVRDDVAALAEYAKSLEAAETYLRGLGVALDAIIQATGFAKQQLLLAAANALATTEEVRKRFDVHVEDVRARYRSLFPNEGLYPYDAQEAALSAIHSKLQAVRTSPDISALLQSLYDVVDTAIEHEAPAQQAKEKAPLYDLSALDIHRLRAEFEKTPHKAVLLLNLQERMARRLAAMVAANPTRVDLYERYQKIVQAYNRDKDATEIQKVMDDLLAMNETLDVEARRFVREGLDDEEQLAVFDLLQKESLSKADREKVKEVAKALLAKLKAGKLKIDHWREKATAQAQIKAEIINELFAHLPDAAYGEAEISAVAGAVFTHMLTTGPGASAPRLH
ncbi:type I restriction endonuclease subunit R [Ideonella livida]|uniref:Type I restriction enzyme endonuclease subunit n=1 Tax=Ideonella livida TaxID=2707176 RepID=A0A7C9TIM9_9BURK|nr:type I restriction endonuclease subunit R [Ideonella livida]NDY90383.1 type I restriction endonuclease subunit R [Ideonella livida]